MLRGRNETKEPNELQLIHSIYILNKSGGLIYQKDFTKASKLTTNDHVRLGGLFYGLHTITKNLSPLADCTGLEVMETEFFKLHCFQTLTGTKFFMIADPKHVQMQKVLEQVYELYSDYVLKNPFYETEQPIRCEKFDMSMNDFIKAKNTPEKK